MAIKFTDKYTANSELHHVVFHAVVDSNSVSCFIVDEVLQDISPAQRFKSIGELYKDNSGIIHGVATRLITAGRIKNSQLHITAEDMKMP